MINPLKPAAGIQEADPILKRLLKKHVGLRVSLIPGPLYRKGETIEFAVAIGSVDIGKVWGRDTSGQGKSVKWSYKTLSKGPINATNTGKTPPSKPEDVPLYNSVGQTVEALLMVHFGLDQPVVEVAVVDNKPTPPKRNLPPDVMTAVGDLNVPPEALTNTPSKLNIRQQKNYYQQPQPPRTVG